MEIKKIVDNKNEKPKSVDPFARKIKKTSDDTDPSAKK